MKELLSGLEPVFPCCLRRPLQNQGVAAQRPSDPRTGWKFGPCFRAAAHSVWHSVAGPNRRAVGLVRNRIGATSRPQVQQARIGRRSSQSVEPDGHGLTYPKQSDRAHGTSDHSYGANVDRIWMPQWPSIFVTIHSVGWETYRCPFAWYRLKTTSA
jgi:hypothetical protein